MRAAMAVATAAEAAAMAAIGTTIVTATIGVAAEMMEAGSTEEAGTEAGPIAATTATIVAAMEGAAAGGDGRPEGLQPLLEDGIKYPNSNHSGMELNICVKGSVK